MFAKKPIASCSPTKHQDAANLGLQTCKNTSGLFLWHLTGVDFSSQNNFAKIFVYVETIILCSDIIIPSQCWTYAPCDEGLCGCSSSLLYNNILVLTHSFMNYKQFWSLKFKSFWTVIITSSLFLMQNNLLNLIKGLSIYQYI